MSSWPACSVSVLIRAFLGLLSIPCVFSTAVVGEENANDVPTPVVVSMIFPVAEKCSWSDTYGASRAGGARRHIGQDIIARQMAPIVAVFDGTVYLREGGGHNTASVEGDCGWTAVYMHINNDTPGTNNGQGGRRYAFSAGLKSGDRVRAGQLIAWVGNSGNAEGGVHHLHFELHGGGGKGYVNPASSLHAAKHLDDPISISSFSTPITDPNGIGDDEIRINGTVISVDTSTKTLTLDSESIVLPGQPEITLSPTRRKLVVIGSHSRLHNSLDKTLSVTLKDLHPGSRISTVGRNLGVGATLTVRDLIVYAQVIVDRS